MLDAIEVALRLASEHQSKFCLANPSKAVDELNYRFREHGVGYQVEGFKLVKVSATYTHEAIVKPALALLHAAQYEGADGEFRKAHEHYRHGRHEEAITECLKALESTLKVICGRRGWRFDERATARQLIEIVFQNGLIPDYLDGQFKALRGALESGIPAIRNRMGGHGAGAKPRRVPEHLVAYALHLTAAAILFLAESEAGSL